MKKLILFCSLLLSASFSVGQALCPPNTTPINNDTTTGTTLYKTAKVNSSGNAVIMATTDTTGYAGWVVANAGTNGTACLATSGVWPAVVDNTTTALHYIQISSSVGGDGKDSGASTIPTSGGDVLGRVQSASTGVGSVSMITVFPPEIQAFNPSGAGISGPGSSIVNDFATWGNGGGSAVIDPGSNCGVVNNTVHCGNTFFSGTYTTSNLSPTTITNLTSPTIAANSTVGFHCSGLWSSSVSGALLGLSVNASQTPQAIWYAASQWSNATTEKQAVSVTNATLVAPTGAGSGASGTNYQWVLDGTIQWNAGTPGTFSVQAATNVGTTTITIVNGAHCSILP